MDQIDHPALRTELLTYLGNKRSLLALIAKGVALCADDRSAAKGDRLFLDAFSGSGVVARWARLNGFSVGAVDIEEYARPFGTAYLQIAPGEVQELFRPVAERLAVNREFRPYDSVIDYLNRITEPRDSEAWYFSRHYAPRNTERPDIDGERLFYTQENARRIDAILELVHDRELFSPIARDVILAGLLVQMSVHINTSGVMKGFHHGWGGRGRDALSRILAPITLSPLPLIDGPRGRFVVGDASIAVREFGGTQNGITYADPPYTIHQYGSNYHLLTTAVRNDRYDPGPVGPGRRAGIRSDHNRSPFASRRLATSATESFLSSVPTRHLLYSYNDGGILSPETLLSLLSEDRTRRVQLVSSRHTKFRGGKSTQVSRGTEEFLFVVDRTRRQSRTEFDQTRDTLLRAVSELRLFDQYIDPRRFVSEGKDIGAQCVSSSQSGYKLTTARGDAIHLRDDFSVAEVMITAPEVRHVAGASSTTKQELFDLYFSHGKFDLALKVLKSFKVKKYHAFFESAAERLSPHLDVPATERLRKLYARVLERPPAF